MDYIIFNSDGSVAEQILKRYIQQGNTGVDKFFVGYPGGLETDYAQAVFTLPNETTVTELGTFYEDFPYEADDPIALLDDATAYAKYIEDGGQVINGWVFTLTTAETTYNGIDMVAVRILRSASALVNYPFVLVINETGVRPDTDSGVTIEELDSYLLNIDQKIAHAVQINTDSELSLTSENPVQNKVVTGALNTKLDKVTTTPLLNFNIYGVNNSGQQAMVKASWGPYGETLAMWNSNEQLSTATPTSNDHAANKKYVDDIAQNLREVAEGKCKTFVLSYEWDIAFLKELDVNVYLYNSSSQNFDDISEDIQNGDYDDATAVNAAFNTQDSSIDVYESSAGQYFIFRAVDFGLEGGWVLIARRVFMEGFAKKGDIILVLETGVPDRWCANEDYLYKLETTKVDLNLYPAKAETETISGNWTHTGDLRINDAEGGSFWVGTTQSTAEPVYTQIGRNSIYMRHDVWGTSLTLSYDGGEDSYGFDLKDGNNTYYLAIPFENGTLATQEATYGALFNKTGSGTTTIKWSEFLYFAIGSDTTFTFETTKTGYWCEYKARIQNMAASAVTLTFTGVTNILCNDDNCTVTNGTNSTLVLPASTTIEISIVNNKMVAVNFAA